MTFVLSAEGDRAGRQFGAFVPDEAVRVGPTDSGPLDGMTFAVKDLIDVAGYATGGGNPDWRATHAPATTMAPAPAALLAAGATLIGKTITDELAFSLEGANVHYGTPVNPAAPDRLPGGSSSGSAVAVAAGLCDIALGTDTGGSVRIPASFCGIHGIRPTHGRVSTQGVISFGRSFDTVGWFARDAATLRQAGAVLLQTRRNLPIERLVLAADIFDIADADVADTARAAIADWPVAGAIRVLGDEDGDILEAFRVIQGAEIWQSLGGWIESVHPRFGEAIAERFASTKAITVDEVARWQPFRAAFRDRMAALLPPGVGIVLPTSPTVAPPKSIAKAELDAFYAKALMVNAVAGLAGLPQVSLPLAEAGGLPVGISILGGRGQDEALLDLACALSGVQSQRAGGTS